MQSLAELKSQLGGALRASESVRPHEGVPTGHSGLNHFLLWGGFPLGGLSLLVGPPGLGSTSLWLGAASHLTQEKKWVAWLGHDQPLLPLSLQQQGIDLSYLWTATCDEKEKYFLILQELLAADLFSLVACDLDQFFFSNKQWQKILRQARRAKAAVVFVGQPRSFRRVESLFSLIIKLNKNSIYVQRALHRPVPCQLPRRSIYAHLMYQLTENRRAIAE